MTVHPSAQPPAPGQPSPPPPGRGNTLILIVVGLVVVCLSCSIVALAGLAGYNDGVRHVERMAEVTRQAAIVQQYDLALTDVAAGNNELAALRLEHVVLTLGADSSEAAALLTRVHAVTPTPTPSLTPMPSPTPADTPTPEVTATESGPALPEPEAVFADAQAAFIVRDWGNAIELLDILRGLDPDYQAAEVQRMLHEALTELSLQYLREPSGEHLAEGILLAQRAQTLGPIGDLAYEAYIAGRYLDALNAEGMECLLAVRAWEGVYAEAPQYRDVTQRLANSYAACGDAYTYQTEYCPAEQYYNWSLQIVYDADVAARRNEASEICAQATPTPTPTIEGLPAEGTPSAGTPSPPQ